MVTLFRKSFCSKNEQRNFAILGALTAGSMVLGIKQGADQEKAMKEQTEMLEEKQEQLNKTMNRIAKAAEKNPSVAPIAAQAYRENAFSAPAASKLLTWKNIKGTAASLGHLVAKNPKVAASSLAIGATIPVGSYMADRAIRADAKKNGMEITKDGQLIPKQKSYALSPAVVRDLKLLGKNSLKAIKKNPTSSIAFGTLGAIPIGMSYLGQKRALKEQMNSTIPGQMPTNEQKTYSRIGLGYRAGVNALSMLGKAKAGLGTFAKHPGKSTLGGISKALQMGGRKGLENTATKLQTMGKINNNPLTERLGTFLKENPKTGLAFGAIPVGAASWGLFDVGSNATKKAIKAVDKEAFRFEEGQNKKTESGNQQK